MSIKKGIGRTMLIGIVIAIVIIAAIAAVLLNMMSQKPTTYQSSTTTPTSITPTTVPSSNATLVAGFFEDVTSLSPVNWFTISDLDVLQLIFNTLVEVNSSGLPAPGIAERWTISGNGTIYTFYLYHNITWQDGVPLTANDVAFTFNYWERYHFPYYAVLADLIKNVTIINNYTVQVTLAHPDAGFLLDLADLGMIIPEHIWEHITNPYNETNLTGDGPFIFVSRTPGVDIVLKANPHYFMGEPHFKYLIIKIFSSVDSALAALESGSLNLLELPPGTDLTPLSSYQSIHIVNTPSTMIYYISMNTQVFPFNNTLVRQAIAYAINKTAILELAFLGQGYIANSVISPSLSYWYNPNVINYTYDPSLAVQLLKEAGFSNSTGKWVDTQGQQLTFTLLIPNQAPWIEMATIIKQELGQIGIPVNVESVDPTTWENTVIGTHNYQMTLGSWRLYFDPMLFLEPSFDSNETGPNGLNFAVFKNSTVDNLILKAIYSPSLSIEKYYVDQIQYFISQQVPWIMLSYGQDIWAVQGYTNWSAVPRYGLWYYTNFLSITPSG
ncbi:ABC transporter substrate-binding protein [Sulfolobus tengchongensis]|uniref:ABC transporter substrate-binding protein n=1 Tax=Sulfolobus tengchongensis TaxID=207809 RepID=A0AAX4KWV2_9CREN